MKAYRIVEWGRPAEFVDVPVPAPAAGEVLIRMRGAGLCRSDLDILDAAPGTPPYADVLPAGFTLGHENAGIVEMAGAGVTDLQPGDGVVVHHMRSCGYCDFCHHGHEQSCRTFARGAIGMTRGVGFDGGRARRAGPVRAAGRRGIRPDRRPARLDDGKRYGADVCLDFDARTAETIMDLTGGRGADAIIDLVGTDGPLALASAVSRPHGRIVLVGLEGGGLTVGWGRMATTCKFAVSLGSTRADLREVCNLAADGKLIIDLERFAFDDVEAGFAKLRAGQLRGRAVITFD